MLMFRCYFNCRFLFSNLSIFSFLSDSEFENEIFDQVEEIGAQANEQRGFGDTTQNSSSEFEVDEAAREQTH